MKTINSIYSTTTEVKRSKFITYLVPIENYSGLQERLKQENPKANHVVYALRSLNSYEQIVENSSDDGEPKGCAGLPTLNVLRGKEMINCAVLIVRYFGGIKLGTGGMARAYALAVKDVLEISTLIEYEKEFEYSFTTTYKQINRILYLLKQIEIEKFERVFEVTSVEWSINGSQEKIDKLKQELKEISFKI